MFYDPIDKKFHSNDKDKTSLKSLTINYKSNLDYYSATFSMDAININEIYKIEQPQLYNILEIRESFIKEFSFLNIEDYDNILKQISTIMEIKDFLILKHKIKFIKEIKIPPALNIVFLYKKKDKGFLGEKTVYDNNNNYNMVKYYDLEQKKEINNFYNLLDENFEYIYSLEIKKIIKRNYNRAKSNWSQLIN